MDDASHYYEVLHLASSASPDDIRQAYLDLVRVWHPDRFVADTRLQRIAEERLREINEAYRRLLREDPFPRESHSVTDEFAGLREPLRTHRRAFPAGDVELWVRSLAIAGLILAFLFGAKSAFDALSAPFPRSDSLRTYVEPVMRLLHLNPGDYGSGPSVPAALPGPRPHDSTRRAPSAPDPIAQVPVLGSAGMGEFQIWNETDFDCSIGIFSRTPSQPTPRLVYVQGHGDASVQYVRPGVYRLHASFGRGWKPTSSIFENAAGDYWIGPFEFFETQSSVERTGLKYSVRLRLPRAPQ